MSLVAPQSMLCYTRKAEILCEIYRRLTDYPDKFYKMSKVGNMTNISNIIELMWQL